MFAAPLLVAVLGCAPGHVSWSNGDDELRHGLMGLHDLFVQAPLLGSLIDPTGGDLMSSQRLGRIEPLLDRLVHRAYRMDA